MRKEIAMPIDKQAAVQEMYLALQKYRGHCAKYREQQAVQTADLIRENAEIFVCLKATIERFSPLVSAYRISLPEESVHTLAGTLQTLREDWSNGRLQSFQELIHGETFSDFLAMADHLLSQVYRDAAAVIAAAVLAGGVLEQHLRALCVKHDVDPTYMDGKGETQPKMINAMNAELYKAGVYAKNFMQQITAWATIRNDAAHGDYGKVDRKQVELMVAGLRHFTQSHPA
jgi:hypothetical protein